MGVGVGVVGDGVGEGRRGGRRRRGVDGGVASAWVGDWRCVGEGASVTASGREMVSVTSATASSEMASAKSALVFSVAPSAGRFRWHFRLHFRS